MIDYFGISLVGRNMCVSHQALVYLVHKPLIGFRVRLIERAVDLSLVFFWIHQVGDASGSPRLSLDVPKRWHVRHREFLVVCQHVAFQGQ